MAQKKPDTQEAKAASQKALEKPGDVGSDGENTPILSVAPQLEEGQAPGSSRGRNVGRTIEYGVIIAAVITLIGVILTVSKDWLIVIKQTPVPTPLPNGIRLADFEAGHSGWFAALANTENWEANEMATGVTTSPESAVGNHALKCEFEFIETQQKDPRAICYLALDSHKDWSEYNTIWLHARSQVEDDARLRMFIVLGTGLESCWHELDNFQELGDTYSVHTFTLDVPKYKSCVDNYTAYNQPLQWKNEVRRLHLAFLSDKPVRGAALIDDIWLLKP
jgi:hypothetical protein